MALLSNMRFAGFEFPYNPATLDIRFEKRFAEYEYPDIDGAELEKMGLSPKVVSGRGAFFGPGAYTTFLKLKDTFEKSKADTLIIPIYGSMRCEFMSLTASHEPTPDYVEYDFEFKESKEINIIKQLPLPPAPPEAKPLGVVRTTANLWLHRGPAILSQTRIRILPKGTTWLFYGIVNDMYGLGADQYSHRSFLVEIEKFTNQATPDAGWRTDVGSQEYYVIKSGDTLQSLSKRYYGATDRWRIIADANKGVITNPNSLPAGLRIRIP